MDSEDLEIVLKTRVRPIVDEATERFLGINIGRLSDDITSKLNRSSLLDISVNTSLGYKAAKKQFKKAFLTKILLLSLGNISEVAKITGKNRRSIHRMINEFSINIKKIKKELIRPYDIRVSTMNTIIENVLADYKTIIHPDKLRQLYLNVSTISGDIIREIPQPMMTFKEAETVFDRRYLKSALAENDYNVSKTARKIELRYETLYRKLRRIGLL